jgi:hypothetical protein
VRGVSPSSSLRFRFSEAGECEEGGEPGGGGGCAVDSSKRDRLGDEGLTSPLSSSESDRLRFGDVEARSWGVSCKELATNSLLSASSLLMFDLADKLVHVFGGPHLDPLLLLVVKFCGSLDAVMLDLFLGQYFGNLF